MAPQVATKRNTTRITAIAIIFVGIALRLIAYAVHRSFWEDEFSIALNLRLRGFLGLLRPLDYEQTMPIPMLWALKSLISLFGTSEYVFRVLPLLAGCFLLPALWFCLRRFFGASVAIVAVALAAVYYPLVYYSQETKQYSLDVLVTVGLLWFGLKVFEPNHKPEWGSLTAFGCLAVVLSQPSVFLLGSIGAAAVCDKRFRLSSRWRVQSMAAGAAWVAMFATMYWAFYRPVSHSSFMQAFWAPGFLNRGPGFGTRLTAGLRHALAGYWLDIPLVLLAALFIYGLWAIFRKNGRTALTLTAGPFLFVFAAASFRLYPLGDRLLLFTLPLLFCVYAAGITGLANFAPANLRIVITGCMFFAMITPLLYRAPQHVKQGFNVKEPVQQVIDSMNSIDSHSPVYTMGGEVTPWLYYAGDWTQPQLLKQHIDAAYRRRIYEAFHLSVYAGDPGLRQDHASRGGRLEISGEIPAERTSAGDAQWARDGARSVAQAGKSVWIFVPEYYIKWEQRHLLGLLNTELGLRGGRCVTDQSHGRTIARLYVFDGESSAAE